MFCMFPEKLGFKLFGYVLGNQVSFTNAAFGSVFKHRQCSIARECNNSDDETCVGVVSTTLTPTQTPCALFHHDAGHLRMIRPNRLTEKLAIIGLN